MRAWAGRVSIARPAMTIRPEVGRWLPARQSNIVVLPAPLGPTSPTISPASTVKDIPSTATWPPKRLVTASATRIGVLGCWGVGRGEACSRGVGMA